MNAASFYIQNKGLHSGRPLKSPICNCFAVYTDVPFSFEIVYALFRGRFFEPHIHGSVIPTIRIGDVQNVLCNGLIKVNDNSRLKTIGDIDKIIASTKSKIRILADMQFALCREVISK